MNVYESFASSTTNKFFLSCVPEAHDTPRARHASRQQQPSGKEPPSRPQALHQSKQATNQPNRASNECSVFSLFSFRVGNSSVGLKIRTPSCESLTLAPPSTSLSLSHSLTHTHTHLHTHSLSQLPLPLSLTHLHTHSLSLSLPQLLVLLVFHRVCLFLLDKEGACSNIRAPRTSLRAQALEPTKQGQQGVHSHQSTKGSNKNAK